MKHNKIEVEFSIHNNEVFDPGEITRRLKLTPKKFAKWGIRYREQHHTEY